MRRKSKPGPWPKPPALKASERVMVYLTPGERLRLEGEMRKAGFKHLAAYLMSPWREAKRKTKGG
jgi:hypothetical protein